MHSKKSVVNFPFQIAKLIGCAFVELSVRLNVDRDWHDEALSIQSGSQGRIIFRMRSIN